MKKRIMLTATLILTIFAALCGTAGAATLANFYSLRDYTGQFTDVPDDAWYAEYVELCYEYELLDGLPDGEFRPDSKVTFAELYKCAAILHKNYYTGSASFSEGQAWYLVYIDYLQKNGILAVEYPNVNAYAAKSDVAMLLFNALPEEALTPINRIYEIFDVKESYTYGNAVYSLYRAGVLTGADSYGTFLPGKSITRSELAAILARCVNASERRSFSLKNPLTPEQLYSRSTNAVFYIEVFDIEGELLKTGSGFFISSDGKALTNYHVLNGAYSAKITTSDGTEYDIAGVYDYLWKKDIALISVDGVGFEYLTLGDVSSVKAGTEVYAIGSPLGLQNTFSRGIVSSMGRVLDGVEYIQIDAAVSHGSSGGALLDSTGAVIGITSATAEGGQNLNLAIPITYSAELSDAQMRPLDALIENLAYYEGYYPAPDFGAMAGLELYEQKIDGSTAKFSYLVSAFDDEPYDLIQQYKYYLEHCAFSAAGTYTNDGKTYDAYHNTKYSLFLFYRFERINGRECFTILIM